MPVIRSWGSLAALKAATRNAPRLAAFRGILFAQAPPARVLGKSCNQTFI